MLKYSQTEEAETVDEIRHPLIRECLRHAGTSEYLEITSFADIPSSGSGLGSSSAFSVGLLNALLSLQGRMPSHETCASGACEVEMERLGEPIGKQDQYAAAYGGLNYIRFNADGSVHVDPIILDRSTRDALDERLVLFYTGVTRKASEILTEQSRNIVEDRRVFENLERIRDQADELRAEITQGRIDAIGRAMHQGWLLKKQMASGVSSSGIDRTYQAAIDAGATGGKILGAGGGGFFLFYVEPERRQSVIDALSGLRHIDFSLERQGTRIIYVGD